MRETEPGSLSQNFCVTFTEQMKLSDKNSGLTWNNAQEVINCNLAPLCEVTPVRGRWHFQQNKKKDSAACCSPTEAEDARRCEQWGTLGAPQQQLRTACGPYHLPGTERGDRQHTWQWQQTDTGHGSTETSPPWRNGPLVYTLRHLCW